MKRNQSPYVINNGKAFVEVGAVITALVVYDEGLPVHFFGKSKKAYLPIDTAIAWCQEEKKHHAAEKYDQMVAALEKKKQDLATTAENKDQT